LQSSAYSGKNKLGVEPLRNWRQLTWRQRVWLAWMNPCIIIGAMNHDSGGEITKLFTTTAGIQKNACCDNAGVV
jgi:hypothetical protein